MTLPFEETVDVNDQVDGLMMIDLLVAVVSQGGTSVF